MTGTILIICGFVLVVFGGIMLTAWVSGKKQWFTFGVYELNRGRNEAKLFGSEGIMLLLTFIGTIIAPLLGGAIMIVFGLKEMQ